MNTHSSHYKNLILVIDQGSHASRVALFSETGEPIYLKTLDISTHSTSAKQPAFEQDAQEILQSILTLLGNIPGDLSEKIKCAGLCTQRSTIVAWHKISGKALSPAISWRDTRSQPLIKKLSTQAEKIRKISGLPLSAHYSAGKINWLLHNNPQVKLAALDRHLCIAPLASYLLFHLLNETPCIIDHSNAQRSQLFDTHHLNWSSELLQLFEIESSILPACVPVMYHYGHLQLKQIPLTCVVGDQNAALYAYPPLTQNNALVNIGTGAFVLSPTPERTDENLKLLHTLSSSNEKQAHFVSEGTVNGAGTALSWALESDPVSIVSEHSVSKGDIYTQLPNWLKEIKSPPIFINTIAGLGSPWWSDAGEPEFIGEGKHLQAHRYVAIIESIIFLTVKNIEQLSIKPNTLFVSGGLSQLDGLCQKLADLSQITVQRFNTTETTARGCAWLANQMLNNKKTSWRALQVSQQFQPTDIQEEAIEIQKRYQQFVGELYRRCTSD